MEVMSSSSISNMQNYFEERMSKFEAELKKKASGNTGSLAEEFGAFKTFVMQTLKAFSQQLDTVAREMDRMETRSRRNIMLLHGVDELKTEDTTHIVAEVVKQHLKLDRFTEADVKRCHRMGRTSSNGKPRPILVKFQTAAIRDSVWFAKAKLKGSGITLSEFLTRTRHSAFMAARERFGVTKCWTREGFVYILDPDGNRHRISSMVELQAIKCSEIGKPASKLTATKGRRAVTSKK